MHLSPDGKVLNRSKVLITTNDLKLRPGLIFLFHIIFNALDMPATQSLDFAAQLKIAAYFFVVQYTETIDDGGWASDHFDNFVGAQVEVLLVPNGKNHRIGKFKSLGQIRFDPGFIQLVLIAEKSFHGMIRCRIGILLFKFPPVLDIRIVYRNFRSHFG